MRLLAPDRWPGLPIRIISALVLAPPVLVALYLGSPYSEVVTCVVAAVIAWEWARLCGGEAFGLPGVVLSVSVLAVSVVAALSFYSVAGWMIVTGAACAALAAARSHLDQPLWYAIGVMYLGSAVLAFLWLRADPISGRAVILWLVAVVWATDVGAYAAGRAIGGPRLAPRISSGKTWAGLAGGMVAAMIAGSAVALAFGSADYFPGELGRIALAGAAFAVVAQVGDLFESHLKRRAGVKDSSNLIPGHGGVLDRIDGLLAAALALGGVVLLTGGMGIVWL